MKYGLIFVSFSYNLINSHYVKSVQIRSYIWSVFSCIQTEYISVFSPNTGKYGPEITCLACYRLCVEQWLAFH